MGEPRRSRGPVWLLVGCLVACDAPPGAAPQVTPQLALPPAPLAATPGKSPWLRLTVNLLGVEGDRWRVYGPEGEQRLRIVPGALSGAPPSVGDTVDLECEVDATGLRTIRSVRRHTGLGIQYGTVAALTAERVTLVSPLGTADFVLNRWSDMPVGLAGGEFVSVKHYRTDRGPAVLNTRRFPGRLTDVGVVASVSRDTFVLRSLGGLRTYPLPSAGAVPPVGSTAELAFARDDEDAITALVVAPGPEALVFIGKMSGQNAAEHTFSMVDAWTNALGTVEFTLLGGVPPEIVPGDLVEATWQWKDGARPTIVAMHERALSQVYFGRITALDDTHLAMITLQHQPKHLRRDAETWLPGPVQVGDMADVAWRVDPTGGDPVAELVVKE